MPRFRPRFTVRSLMVAVAVVAILLVSGRVAGPIINEAKRQMSLVSLRFYQGTTSAGVGVPPGP